MSENSNCPSCKRSDSLSTPRSPITISDKRTSISVGIRFCSRCTLLIPNDSSVKFWNGNEAVGINSMEEKTS